MKILLLGKNGQVGWELQRALAPLGSIIALDQEECDLADEKAVRNIVRDTRPEVIVNAAAYTAVDKAESEIEQAYAINTLAPATLAEEAASLGALVLHYSTDYVFDGKLARPYIETDATNPRSVYGVTKFEGELALMAATQQNLILRTSWVVGTHGGNFAKTILRLAAERETFNVIADQWGAPTSAALLADVSAHLIRQWSMQGEAFPFGLYHCVAGGETNWCEYARYVVRHALQAGKILKATPEKIQAITTADYPTLALRPANSRLDCSKFKQTFKLELPHWKSGLTHHLDSIL